MLDQKELSTLLSAYLETIEKPADHNEVRDYYIEIVNAMLAVAEITVPAKKYSKHLCPNWKEKLKELHSDMMIKRREWIMVGRARGTEAHIEYKRSHTVFRRRFRQVVQEEETALFEEVEKSYEIDSRRFWDFVKRRRGGGNITTSEICFGDKVLRDPEEICEAWAEHYEKLYTPLENETFDERHKTDVINKFREYMIESQSKYDDILDRNVDEEEVQAGIKDMKMEKSGGPDLLTNEHIYFGGPVLVSHLQHLFQLILAGEQSPKEMRKGLTISIPKDPRKKKQTSENQRGITLLNVMYKLFEKVILNRFLWWRDMRNLVFPDPAQCAYQQGKSCLNASFNLQECITHNTEQGSTVYTCFLDTSKAFDVVWHIGIFVKLYELGVNGKLWRVIVAAYTDMTSAVWYDGIISKSYPVKQSVRQGGVLSPWLYLLFINDLLVELRNSGIGARVCDEWCGAVVQADDMALIALTICGLQCMMDICNTYSQKWRYSYNSTKSKITVHGEKEAVKKKRQLTCKWYLGSEQVLEFDDVTHVGIIISKNMCNSKGIKEACSKGRGCFMGLAGSGVRPSGLSPITIGKLYKTIVLPRALYGCELWNGLTVDSKVRLERMHRFCMKIAQGLNDRVRTDMVMALIGMHPIMAEIEKRKLLFLGSILRLPSEDISKKILVFKMSRYMMDPTLVKTGYVPDMFEILAELDLMTHIERYFQESVFPGKPLWKAIVNKAINTREEMKYNQRINTDQDFVEFRKVVPSITSGRLWKMSRRIPRSWRHFHWLVASLVTAHLDDNMLCELCGMKLQNQMKHLIVECDGLEGQRNDMWNEIDVILDEASQLAMKEVTNDELFHIMLGGYHPVSTTFSDFQTNSIMHVFAKWANSIRMYVSKDAKIHTAFRTHHVSKCGELT